RRRCWIASPWEIPPLLPAGPGPACWSRRARALGGRPKRSFGANPANARQIVAPPPPGGLSGRRAPLAPPRSPRGQAPHPPHPPHPNALRNAAGNGADLGAGRGEAMLATSAQDGSLAEVVPQSADGISRSTAGGRLSTPPPFARILPGGMAFSARRHV